MIDLHSDALYEHMKDRKDITVRSDKGHLDFPRMRAAGVSGQVLAVWVSPTELKPGEYLDFAVAGAAAFNDVCARCPELVAPARTPDELRAAAGSGRTGVILGVEGGHALEGRLENLERLFELGARVLTVTWCNSNELADSSSDKEQPHNGLSPLGKEAIRLMNRLGMIVDVSHAADRSVLDIVGTSGAPVIASHSGVRALRDFNRNLTDEGIRAIAAGGGVVGVVFLPYFLREPEADASTEDVLNCIDHIVQLVGPDHAGFGSDFDGFGGTLKGLEDVTKMPELVAGLKRRCYSQPDIDKISGANFLRVWDAAAEAAG